MQFDPDNPVVKLCAEGMNSEALGQIEKAKQLFQQAWEHSSNEFEKFTSAHYLARNQKDTKDELKWNLTALTFAKAIQDEDMRSHLPSLYLNTGKSYETLGYIAEAKENYKLAARSSPYLPVNAYGTLIKSGINSALQRMGLADFKNPVLEELISKWCERKQLKPLSLILPSYLSNSGQGNDVNQLINALSLLSSTRCLCPEEQSKIDSLVSELSATG